MNNHAVSAVYDLIVGTWRRRFDAMTDDELRAFNPFAHDWRPFHQFRRHIIGQWRIVLTIRKLDDAETHQPIFTCAGQQDLHAFAYEALTALPSDHINLPVGAALEIMALAMGATDSEARRIGGRMFHERPPYLPPYVEHKSTRGGQNDD